MKKEIDEKYLKGDHWNLVKKFRLEIDKYRCALCGGTKNIDVYHTNDKRLGNEKLTDVVTICEECYSELCEFLDDGVLSAESLFSDCLSNFEYSEKADTNEMLARNYLHRSTKEDKRTEKIYLNILEKLVPLKDFTYITKWLKSYRRFIDGI